MSCVPVAVEDGGNEACANCGKHGSDTVKLKNCTACHLVKYCGVDCQKAHRKQHKKACKQRAAELKDEHLYSQGQERPEGDFCPICTLPIALPLQDNSGLVPCCMKRICNGCNVASQKRGRSDCPFCRTPLPKYDAGKLAMIMTRVKKKDPEAIDHLGEIYYHGMMPGLLQMDMQKAVGLWEEAAELGSIGALYNLGTAYYFGNGVQENKAKGAQFWTKAALQGCGAARYIIGIIEGGHGNYDSAVRHFLIAAKMGSKGSVEKIKEMFMEGFATKGQYAQALSGYQDAVEESQSQDRDEAKRVLESSSYQKWMADNRSG